MKSKIILYKGRRGSGKTLSMTKDLYKYYFEGYKVLANYKTSFAKYISEEDILKLSKDSKISKCIIAVDEIQIFFDSRRAMKKENLDFSNFIQQIRKRDIILLGTTQFANTVDLRFRQHCDIIARPHFIEKYKVCKVEYIDITAIEDIMQEIPQNRIIVYNAEKVFKLFETKQMIKGKKK